MPADACICGARSRSDEGIVDDEVDEVDGVDGVDGVVGPLKVAVLGVGLIGGSIGLASRSRLDAFVTGWDPDPSACARALELGAIDACADDIAQAVACAGSVVGLGVGEGVGEGVGSVGGSGAGEGVGAGAVVDSGSGSRDLDSDSSGTADVVFVASPVASLTQVVHDALNAAGPHTIVTDVGSTKLSIVSSISDPRFIGGHPLAGSELAGVLHARSDLFAGATWFLCSDGLQGVPEEVPGTEGRGPGTEEGGPGTEGQGPGTEGRGPGTEESGPGTEGQGENGEAGEGGDGESGRNAEASRRACSRLSELIVRLGALPVEIDALTHDRLMATVSQLPHVLANLLVSQAAGSLDAIADVCDSRGGGARAVGSLDAAFVRAGGGARRTGDLPGSVVGPSFRDATRVAGSNSAIWTDIYMSNRPALIAAIDELVSRLERVRALLIEGDAEGLAAWNELARAQRVLLGSAEADPRRAGVDPRQGWSRSAAGLE